MIKTKICSTCKIEKNVNEFAFQNKKEKIIRSSCKKCSNLSQRNKRNKLIKNYIMITSLSFWEIAQLIIGFIIITSIVGIICFIIYEKLLNFCEKNEQLMNKFNTLSKSQ